MAKQKKHKKIRSHVKRLKLQQKKNPMKPETYRKKLRVARRKDFFRNFGKVLGILGIAFLLLFFGGNALLKQKTGQNLFECMEEARQVVAESTPDTFRLSETSYIYSTDGTQMAELAEDTDATYLEYDQIPADVVNAFVAVEDRSFWTNGGIDYKGIARACITYVRTKGARAEGASTITQQLARGTFLSNEKTLSRKLKEIFIARELTKKYSKEQIMEFYCNTCCFANGIYGVEDASQAYFRKPVKELSLSETAYICAIPNRPEYYNPLKNSENAITRRDKILQDMYTCGYITETSGEEALVEQIAVAEPEEEEQFYNYEVTYAIDCAVRYLMELNGFDFRYEFQTDDEYAEYKDQYDEFYRQARHELYTGGYRVYTTMDVNAQNGLQGILDEQLAFSEDIAGTSGIYELQGAMTVIDNASGKVVAMIGGRSQDQIRQTYSLNRGYQGFAQPGSSFKPLAVYAPAIEEGYTADSMLREIDVDQAKKSTIAEITEMTGEEMTLRRAVENSKNGCAYWLFSLLTPQDGLSYVTNMNFSQIVPSDYNMSAALGGLTWGVSTVEMANAYHTLENHGEYVQTDCISSIEDADGNEIYVQPAAKTVYSSEAADQMTDILKGVLTRGTAKGLQWYDSTGIEAAGKTGTTNNNMAGWFCGYTPYYTIAVWVGCDLQKEVENLQGNTYPAYIWKEAMLYMIDGLPDKEFDISEVYSRDYSTPEPIPEPETLSEEVPEVPETELPGTEIPAEPGGTTQEPGSIDGSVPSGGTTGANPGTPAEPANPSPPANPQPTDPGTTQPENPASGNGQTTDPTAGTDGAAQ